MTLSVVLGKTTRKIIPAKKSPRPIGQTRLIVSENISQKLNLGAEYFDRVITVIASTHEIAQKETASKRISQVFFTLAFTAINNFLIFPFPPF